MTLEKLIGLADVKEKQAMALLENLKDRIQNEEMQNAVDAYCLSMADVYVMNYKTDLQDKTIMNGLKKHIAKIGANEKHSGHRFYEALYKKLDELNDNKKEDKNVM